MNRTLQVFVATLALLATTLGAPAAQADPHGRAVLQGLDKVTARVSTLEATLGEAVRFGTLEVIVRHCDKRPPEEMPESAAFMDIWEVRPDEPATSIFRGWMFASSPALHALEHPVYDVWVLDCKDKLPEGGAGEVKPDPANDKDGGG